MKRFGVALGLAFGLAAFSAASAEAATFTWQFCPDDEGTCAANNITSATITVTDSGFAGDDLTDSNDYLLTVQITGTNAAKSVDQIAVTISDLDTPGSYEGGNVPQLTVAPGGTAAWAEFFGGISGSPASCTSNETSGDSFCANSIAPDTDGPPSNQTNTWSFYVDLVAGEVITAGSGLNLRANFAPSGNLSPNFDTGVVTGSTSGIITGSSSGLVTTVIPEPTTLALLGSGLLVAARKLRRRKTNDLTA